MHSNNSPQLVDGSCQNAEPAVPRDDEEHKINAEQHLQKTDDECRTNAELVMRKAVKDRSI